MFLSTGMTIRPQAEGKVAVTPLQSAQNLDLDERES